MSHTKAFLEEVSEEIGCQGRITPKVIKEAERRMEKMKTNEPVFEPLIDVDNTILSQKFFSAGNAVFTVHNASGKHYTFKIRQKKADPNKDEWQDQMPYFIYILTGQDNTNDFTYMGVYNPNTNGVYSTKSSKYNKDTEPMKVVNWALKMVERGDWSNPRVKNYGIKGKGKCARCGRDLTTPESIRNGIGPECIKFI